MTLNKCECCGLEYAYAKDLHKCRTRPEPPYGTRETWVQECMRKQREGIRK